MVVDCVSNIQKPTNLDPELSPWMHAKCAIRRLGKSEQNHSFTGKDSRSNSGILQSNVPGSSSNTFAILQEQENRVDLEENVNPNIPFSHQPTPIIANKTKLPNKQNLNFKAKAQPKAKGPTRNTQKLSPWNPFALNNITTQITKSTTNPLGLSQKHHSAPTLNPHPSPSASPSPLTTTPPLQPTDTEPHTVADIPKNHPGVGLEHLLPTPKPPDCTDPSSPANSPPTLPKQ